tara:strand:- start:200 stop:457 length:258 start_codon:yes stop_codon:yes gene_type:complete
MQVLIDFQYRECLNKLMPNRDYKKHFRALNYDFNQNIDLKTRGRVDLNSLMRRLKDEEHKKKKANIVLAGVAVGAVIISGIVISL